MTYGEELDNLHRAVEESINKGWSEVQAGELMKASLHFVHASSTLADIQTLLREVSKTALDRVMKERAGSR